MERFLNPFKGRAVGSLRRHIEKSFVRNVEATERSLLQNRARHGCTSLYQQGACTVDDLTAKVRGAARRVTSRTKGTVRGLSCEDAAALVRVLLEVTDQRCPGTGVAVLDHAHVLLHYGAEVDGLKFDSLQTPNRSGRSRSFQNSFARVPADMLASVVLASDGVPQGYPRRRARPPATNSIINGSVYVHIQCYVQFQVPRTGPDTGDVPVAEVDQASQASGAEPSVGDGVVGQCADVFAMVQVLQDAKTETFAGITTVTTSEPVGGPPFVDLFVVPVADFQAQLLLLLAAGDFNVLRFVECPGKLQLL